MMLRIMEEFALVEETLKQRLSVLSAADKLDQIKKAANDALFMSNLCKTMSAFEQADDQWPEPE